MIIGKNTLRFAIWIYLAVQASVPVGICQDLSANAPLPAKAENEKEKVNLKLTGVSDEMGKGIEKVLGQRLDFLLKAPASAAEASDVAFILENYMRDQGYPDVRVFWDVMSDTLIELRVETGKVSTIEDVVIKGVDSLSSDPESLKKELRELIEAKGRVGNLFRDAGTPFVLEDIETGVNNLTTLMHSKGYWEAVVDHSITALDENNSQRKIVTVTITPGPLVEVRKIELRGITADEQALVQPAVDQLTGTQATADTLIDFEQDIRAAFDRRGFYDTNVRFSETITNGKMDLVITINPGRQVTVGKITITDPDRSDVDVIRERLTPLQGEFYDPDDVSRIVDQLYSTGAFERIEVDEIVEPDDTIDLELLLVEATAQTIGFYGGASSETGLVAGVSYSHLNVFGRLHQFRSILEYSGLGTRGDATYTIPWFPIDGSHSTYRLFGFSRDYAAYDKLEYGWEHSVLFPITENYTTSLRIGGSLVQTSGFEVSPVLIGDPDYYVSYIGISQTFDTQDNQVNPRSGMLASLQLDTAGKWIGSEIEFSRAQARLSYYIPIGEHQHLRLAGATGIISSDEETLPIDLRYFQGGTSSVRSFRDRRGPPYSESGNPIGGNSFNYGSIEYVGSIAGPFQFVLFSDVGNVAKSTQIFNFSDLEIAAGAGIRINLPTGPIRFEYGHNLTKGEGEPAGTFHFVIGVTF